MDQKVLVKVRIILLQIQREKFMIHQKTESATPAQIRTVVSLASIRWPRIKSWLSNKLPRLELSLPEPIGMQKNERAIYTKFY